MRQPNKILFLLIPAGVLALIVILVALFIFLRPNPNPPSDFLPTPTPVAIKLGIQPDGSYTTSSLEKTTIGKTTQDEVLKTQKVISRTQNGPITVYEVQSQIPRTTDEIWTENNKVIFESTNTQILKDGNPPKINTVERDLGQPEEIFADVGLGDYTSLYAYPTNGLAFLINTFTGSIYFVYKFVPMDLAEFRASHPELIQPAPTPVGERPF